MLQCNRLNGEWDFIVLKGKGSLICLALGQILQLLWMGMRFLVIGICSKEDASCRHAGEGCMRHLCHKSGSVVEIWDAWAWFGRGDM